MGSRNRKDKKTYFYKIIDEETIRDEKLLIPRGFARKHVNELSSPIVVRDRNGALWEIVLDKSDDGIWLRYGWQGFVDYYSIKIDQMMLFGYEGNSRFSIFIYDPTATEIDYPIIQPRNQDSNLQESLIERVKTCEVSSPPKKKIRSNGTGNPTEASNLRTLRSGRNIRRCSSIEEIEEGDGMEESSSANALERAKLFKSKNPFFIITMRWSYLYSTRRLNLPACFAREHFKRSAGDHAILYTSSMKSWQVKCLYEENPRKTKFAKGWTDFARENCLEEDDACVFELVGKAMFKVSIFKATEDRNCSDENEQFRQEKNFVERQPDEHPPPCSSRIVSAAEAASKFVSKHPFFQVVMRPTYLNHYVHIPLIFVGRHMKNQKESITLQVGETTWSAAFCNSTHRIRGGWSKFVKDQLLQVGDVCIFELIDREKSLIQVCIFRNGI